MMYICVAKDSMYSITMQIIIRKICKSVSGRNNNKLGGYTTYLQMSKFICYALFQVQYTE